MIGAYFPGNSTVELREAPDPTPGVGQVVVRTRASGICGSDLHLAYRQHFQRGDRTYADVIGGHEPAGEIVDVGPGCTRFAVGDRVLLYHIAGCGQCQECRRGYMILCDSPRRRSYGGGRDGGHAGYVLAEERTCVALPDELTFVDGAFIACGIGTVYEALLRMRLTGTDRLLVVGLGPVGAAAALVARLFGVREVVGLEPNLGRRVWAEATGLFARVAATLEPDDHDAFDTTLDASGSTAGRTAALQAMRTWGRCGLVGAGGTLDVDASELVLQKQATVTGSWVTSLANMAEVSTLLARAGLHPDMLVSDRFPLERVAEAYRLVDAGASGKACIVFD